MLSWSQQELFDDEEGGAQQAQYSAWLTAGTEIPEEHRTRREEGRVRIWKTLCGTHVGRSRFTKVFTPSLGEWVSGCPQKDAKKEFCAYLISIEKRN